MLFIILDIHITLSESLSWWVTVFQLNFTVFHLHNSGASVDGPWFRMDHFGIFKAAKQDKHSAVTELWFCCAGN